MEYLYKNGSIVGIVVLSLFLVSCGGTPDSNQMLTEANTAYQTAQNDTLIVKNAPVALDEAGDAVSKAQSTWKNGADKEVVDHQAYMAAQRVKIAKQTALLNAAQDEVKRAESQRQEVLIEARKAEAEASERRANQARNEAEQKRAEAQAAREDAMAARQKAQELADRVDELEAEQTERGLVLTLGDVLFDVDKAQLKPGGERAVNKLSDFLQEYSERNVQIEGHTDNTGSDSYNQKLSKRRADAVRQALIADGIVGSRIETVGLGEQYPKASNNTSAGRQQNRRVEVIISDKNGNIKQRQQ